MAASTPPPIENFEELIEPHLNGSKVLSYKTRYLTKPGDNYGSIMLAVSAIIKKPDGIIENMELVAKMPPRNEIFWNIFQPERTSPTENSIYCRIAPLFQKFQVDAKVPESEILDVFPKYYGARLSLDLTSKNENVDKNALLLLENLVSNGYKLCSRVDGFDLKHIKIILKNLAKFHAIPIAFRNAHPIEFKEKVFRNLKRFNMNANLSEDDFENFFTKVSMRDIKTLSICTEKLLDEALNLITLGYDYMANPDECPDGPLNSIAHYDFWVNNMLFQYDENNNPVKIKIVDFQTSQYESIAHDVIFLMFSSVRTSILEEKYEELLEYYYNEFIASLKLVDCPTDEYSLELFFDEIKRLAPIQFSHILFMLRVLMMNKDAMPDDFDDLDLKMMEMENCFDEKYYNKLRDFILLYKKFGYM